MHWAANHAMAGTQMSWLPCCFMMHPNALFNAMCFAFWGVSIQAPDDVSKEVDGWVESLGRWWWLGAGRGPSSAPAAPAAWLPGGAMQGAAGARPPVIQAVRAVPVAQAVQAVPAVPAPALLGDRVAVAGLGGGAAPPLPAAPAVGGLPVITLQGGALVLPGGLPLDPSTASIPDPLHALQSVLPMLPDPQRKQMQQVL